MLRLSWWEFLEKKGKGFSLSLRQGTGLHQRIQEGVDGSAWCSEYTRYEAGRLSAVVFIFREHAAEQFFLLEGSIDLTGGQQGEYGYGRDRQPGQNSTKHAQNSPTYSGCLTSRYGPLWTRPLA